MSAIVLIHGNQSSVPLVDQDGCMPGHDGQTCNVGFGSKPDIGQPEIHVRYTPRSGHWHFAGHTNRCTI